MLQQVGLNGIGTQLDSILPCARWQEYIENTKSPEISQPLPCPQTLGCMLPHLLNKISICGPFLLRLMALHFGKALGKISSCIWTLSLLHFLIYICLGSRWCQSCALQCGNPTTRGHSQNVRWDLATTSSSPLAMELSSPWGLTWQAKHFNVFCFVFECTFCTKDLVIDSRSLPLITCKPSTILIKEMFHVLQGVSPGPPPHF